MNKKTKNIKENGKITRKSVDLRKKLNITGIL